MFLKSKNSNRGRFLNLQIASKTFSSIDTYTNNIWECPFSDTKYYLLCYPNGEVRIYKPKRKMTVASVAIVTKSLDWIFAAAVHYREFSSISGLRSSDASSTTTTIYAWQPKMPPNPARCSMGTISPFPFNGNH